MPGMHGIPGIPGMPGTPGTPSTPSTPATAGTAPFAATGASAFMALTARIICNIKITNVFIMMKKFRIKALLYIQNIKWSMERQYALNCGPIV